MKKNPEITLKELSDKLRISLKRYRVAIKETKRTRNNKVYWCHRKRLLENY